MNWFLLVWLLLYDDGALYDVSSKTYLEVALLGLYATSHRNMSHFRLVKFHQKFLQIDMGVSP